MTTVYKYTEDHWVDGHEDYPCCSGLEFEAYNAEGWWQNGSAGSLWDLYVDVIVHHKALSSIYDEQELLGYRMMLSEASHELYEGFTLQELMDWCTRNDIELREDK
jgi:hypothetical protein